jgi:pimeloyl-ACP methyl ester carboxylesterase
MPMIQADDGVRLYAESTGSGTPMLFIHEFAGDHRSWEPQVQYFSAALECITYSARGYPPSDVPADPAAYSQQRAVDDAISVLDALGVRRAHVVGLSMGGVQAARPSLYGLAAELAGIRVPVLIMTGDEDEGCLEPALMLKRAIPGSGLSVLPQTGHTANLEDPAAFNREVDRFLAAVDRGAWRQRDPRSLSASTTGMTS